MSLLDGGVVEDFLGSLMSRLDGGGVGGFMYMGGHG